MPTKLFTIVSLLLLPTLANAEDSKKSTTDIAIIISGNAMDIPSPEDISDMILAVITEHSGMIMAGNEAFAYELKTAENIKNCLEIEDNECVKKIAKKLGINRVLYGFSKIYVKKNKADEKKAKTKADKKLIDFELVLYNVAVDTIEQNFQFRAYDLAVFMEVQIVKIGKQVANVITHNQPQVAKVIEIPAEPEDTKKQSKALPYWKIGGFATAGLGAAVNILGIAYFGFKANRAEQDYEDTQIQIEAEQFRSDAQDNAANANISLAIGSGLLVIGGIFVLLDYLEIVDADEQQNASVVDTAEQTVGMTFRF